MVNKIFIKIWHIIKGTYLNITGKKIAFADKRMQICKKCKHKINVKVIGDICDQCGCVLESKTKIEDEHCDLNKW